MHFGRESHRNLINPHADVPLLRISCSQIIGNLRALAIQSSNNRCNSWVLVILGGVILRNLRALATQCGTLRRNLRVKVDADVATLRRFGHILYCLSLFTVLSRPVRHQCRRFRGNLRCSRHLGLHFTSVRAQFLKTTLVKHGAPGLWAFTLRASAANSSRRPS